MLKEGSDQALLFRLCLGDLLVTSLAWVAAYYLRLHAGLIPPIGDVPPLWWCVRSLPIVLVVGLFSYQVGGLYQLGRRWSLGQEIARIFKATTLALLLLSATTFYIRNPYESRLATVLFWLVTFVGLVLVRRGLGGYLRLRRWRGQAAGKALIVGTGRLARRVERALRANNWIGLVPMGFVDDPSDASHSPPTVGTIDDLPALIEEHGIDQVFVALPLSRFGQTRRIHRLLADTLVEVRIVPDVPKLRSLCVQFGQMEGLPILTLRGCPHHFLGTVVKRGMDVVLSTLGLVILSPLLLVVAVLTKLSDGGSVLYWQERMGLNGHRFQMAKFRTMRVDAEVATGPVWARPQDERRTWLGSFWRRTSIDELPQLYNVLVGDMSLVGPRPERPYFINKFRRSIPRYMLRHSVKAGITGWAQVNGWRGNTSLRKRVQYDLYYIANWSIWLDLRILFLTLFRVLRDRNAY